MVDIGAEKFHDREAIVIRHQNIRKTFPEYKADVSMKFSITPLTELISDNNKVIILI